MSTTIIQKPFFLGKCALKKKKILKSEYLSESERDGRMTVIKKKNLDLKKKKSKKYILTLFFYFE